MVCFCPLAKGEEVNRLGLGDSCLNGVSLVVFQWCLVVADGV